MLRAPVVCIAVIFTSCVLISCVGNRSYRTANPVLHEYPPGIPAQKYILSFIEFDDVGERFDAEAPNSELEQTLNEIKRVNASEESPIYVVFVHGWKNNASDGSGNVWGFRTALASIKSTYPNQTVMGIYFGWRGDVLRTEPFREFTFWNRRDTAMRIPGAHLTESLRSVMMETKKKPGATTVVVGHSFGGLATERTLTQPLLEYIMEHEPETSSPEGLPMPADLIVLLNEAGPATEAKQMLEYLLRKRYHFTNSAGEERPLFLSITSTGDWATHFVFPVGQFMGWHGLSLRSYGGPDVFGQTSQLAYYLHTTANSPILVSHEITSTPPACAPHLFDLPISGITYSLVRKLASPCPNPTFSKNATPYWVMQSPPVFVPDHTTIFKPELQHLLARFLESNAQRVKPTQVLNVRGKMSVGQTGFTLKKIAK